MKKEIKRYFIPGLGERAKDYKHLKGIKVLDIDWNNPKFNIKKADTLVSFSLGMLFAVNYATKLKVENLILCSPTPVIFDPNELKISSLTFICGENETDLILYSKSILKKFKGTKELIIVPKAGQFMNKKYLSVLYGVLKADSVI